MRPIEVIHLYRRDTVDVVRELVLNATPGSQVWLVVPWGARVMGNLVNMKRVKRAAEMAGAEVCLVSAHFQTRALAREAGIPSYLHLPFPLRRYRRARRDRDARAGRIVRTHEQASDRFRRPQGVGLGAVLLSLIVIVALLGVLAGAVVSLVPSATVTLEPISQNVSGSMDISADPLLHDVDYERAMIPGRFVQVIVTGHGDTPASGRVDMPDGHASGNVMFINRTTDTVTVPRGTIVRTGSGVNVRFYTVSDVQLPAQVYGHAQVGVIALEPGLAGNVQELTVNVVEGDIAPKVEVLNDAPMQGGSVSRMPVVDYADFDRLKADMVERLQAEAYSQLLPELEPGEFIPSESLDTQIMQQVFDQVVDQQNDVLSMEMKVVVRGVAVDSQTLNSIAEQLLINNAGEGMALIKDSLQVGRGGQMAVQGNVVTFQITARGVVAPVIDVRRVKQNLRGKKLAVAREWLDDHLELRSEPRIAISPEWWEYLPWLPARLDVVVSSGEGHAASSPGRGR